MSNESPQESIYLQQLHSMTGGDLEARVSMQEVGEACGLDKNEASSIAENLMVDGLVELKTLAGDISLTKDGLASLGYQTAGGDDEVPLEKLSSGPSISDDDRQLLSTLINEIKMVIASSDNLEYRLVEEAVIDMKTLEVQLLSPAPKTAIVISILRGLGCLLEEAGIDRLAKRLSTSIPK